jgi:hypothetical protein
MKTEEIIEGNKCCPFCQGRELEFVTYDYRESQYQDTSKCAIQCINCEAKGPEQEYCYLYKNGTPIEDRNKYEIEAYRLWNNRTNPSH